MKDKKNTVAEVQPEKEFLLYGRNPNEKYDRLLAESIPTEEQAEEMAATARKNGWVDVVVKPFVLSEPDFAGTINPAIMRGRKR